MTRVLICGSRDWTDHRLVWREVDDLLDHYADLEIIHGGARGADTIAGKIAESLGVPVTAVPAEWEKFGKAAGPMRNKVMLGMAPDLVIAFRADGPSRGTDNMCQIARRSGITVRVVDQRGKTYVLPA